MSTNKRSGGASVESEPRRPIESEPARVGPVAGLRRMFLGLVQAAVSIVVATLLVALLMAAFGKDPWAVLRALIEGPLNGYRFADSLTRACPLALCGLAVAVAFRCQAWNIGVEGQFLAGVMACTAVGVTFTSWPSWLLIPAMLLAAMVAGLLWAMPAAWLELRRHVPLVLSTILLNFVAVGLVKYLTQGPLRGSDPSAAQSDPIASQGYLPVLVERTDLHWGCPLAVVIAAALWALLRFHTAGFAMRIAGSSPVAAEWAGIRVPAVKLRILCLSGALGGLAGGIQVAGVQRLLSIQSSEGFGYVAIAVALLGKLNPLGVLFAAVAIGMLDVGASYLERQSQLGVPAHLAQMIKGVLVLAVLVVTGPRLSRWMQRQGRIA